MGRRGRTQLTLHAVLILQLPRNAVALGHVFRGLQHVPIDLGLVLDQPALLQHAHIGLVLDAGNGFQAAGRVNLALTGDDSLRRERDGLQTGGAKAIHGDAGRRDRAPGAQRDLPRHVHARGAFHEGAADDDVFDFPGIEASPLHGMLQDMTGKGHRMRHVERSAP